MQTYKVRVELKNSEPLFAWCPDLAEASFAQLHAVIRIFSGGRTAMYTSFICRAINESDK